MAQLARTEETAESTLNHDLLAPSQSLPAQSFQPQRQQLQVEGIGARSS